MIRNVSCCPHCGAISAGVDDETMSLVLAPDRADGEPCKHLAFIFVSVLAYGQRSGRHYPKRDSHWLWTRGTGLRVLMWPVDPFSNYVHLLVWGMLAGESLPTTEYRLDQGSVEMREAARAGSGVFPLPSSGGPALEGHLDGVGMYSPNPTALVAEVRRLAMPCAGGTE
jgi:hypothetical protein